MAALASEALPSAYLAGRAVPASALPLNAVPPGEHGTWLASEVDDFMDAVFGDGEAADLADFSASDVDEADTLTTASRPRQPGAGAISRPAPALMQHPRDTHSLGPVDFASPGGEMPLEECSGGDAVELADGAEPARAAREVAQDVLLLYASLRLPATHTKTAPPFTNTGLVSPPDSDAEPMQCGDRADSPASLASGFSEVMEVWRDYMSNEPLLLLPPPAHCDVESTVVPAVTAALASPSAPATAGAAAPATAFITTSLQQLLRHVAASSAADASPQSIARGHLGASRLSQVAADGGDARSPGGATAVPPPQPVCQPFATLADGEAQLAAPLGGGSPLPSATPTVPRDALPVASCSVTALPGTPGRGALPPCAAEAAGGEDDAAGLALGAAATGALDAPNAAVPMRQRRANGGRCASHGAEKRRSSTPLARCHDAAASSSTASGMQSRTGSAKRVHGQLGARRAERPPCAPAVPLVQDAGQPGQQPSLARRRPKPLQPEPQQPLAGGAALNVAPPASPPTSRPPRRCATPPPGVTRSRLWDDSDTAPPVRRRAASPMARRWAEARPRVYDACPAPHELFAEAAKRRARDTRTLAASGGRAALLASLSRDAALAAQQRRAPSPRRCPPVLHGASPGGGASSLADTVLVWTHALAGAPHAAESPERGARQAALLAGHRRGLVGGLAALRERGERVWLPYAHGAEVDLPESSFARLRRVLQMQGEAQAPRSPQRISPPATPPLRLWQHPLSELALSVPAALRSVGPVRALPLALRLPTAASAAASTAASAAVQATGTQIHTSVPVASVAPSESDCDAVGDAAFAPGVAIVAAHGSTGDAARVCDATIGNAARTTGLTPPSGAQAQTLPTGTTAPTTAAPARAEGAPATPSWRRAGAGLAALRTASPHASPSHEATVRVFDEPGRELDAEAGSSPVLAQWAARRASQLQRAGTPPPRIVRVASRDIMDGAAGGRSQALTAGLATQQRAQQRTRSDNRALRAPEARRGRACSDAGAATWEERAVAAMVLPPEVLRRTMPRYVPTREARTRTADHAGPAGAAAQFATTAQHAHAEATAQGGAAQHGYMAAAARARAAARTLWRHSQREGGARELTNDDLLREQRELLAL